MASMSFYFTNLLICSNNFEVVLHLLVKFKYAVFKKHYYFYFKSVLTIRLLAGNLTKR